MVETLNDTLLNWLEARLFNCNSAYFLKYRIVELLVSRVTERKGEECGSFAQGTPYKIDKWSPFYRICQTLVIEGMVARIVRNAAHPLSKLQNLFVISGLYSHQIHQILLLIASTNATNLFFFLLLKIGLKGVTLFYHRLFFHLVVKKFFLFVFHLL